jgi:hypothetical protein
LTTRMKGLDGVPGWPVSGVLGLESSDMSCGRRP